VDTALRHWRLEFLWSFLPSFFFSDPALAATHADEHRHLAATSPAPRSSLDSSIQKSIKPSIHPNLLQMFFHPRIRFDFANIRP